MVSQEKESICLARRWQTILGNALASATNKGEISSLTMTQEPMITIQPAHSPESNEIQSFLGNATIRPYNLSHLNKTQIRFRIGLKKASKSATPKWSSVLASTSAKNDSNSQRLSDLEKITNSEVGLKGISVFKALDEAAAELRQEIADLQGWMTHDNGEWVCAIDLAPLVWSRITYLRDIKAREQRDGLSSVYGEGRLEYTNRLDNFFSCQAWSLTDAEIEEVKQVMLQHFPDQAELDEYLQVTVSRPTIVPALHEQLNQQQAECLQQITRFIAEYDRNLEQRLYEAAIVGGEQLAAELLEDLASWEPGRKPIVFRKKIEKHLKKIQVLLSQATPEAGSSLAQMMEHLENILSTANVEAKQFSTGQRAQLQERMDALSQKLLGEQRKLQELASSEGISLARTTAMSLKLS